MKEGEIVVGGGGEGNQCRITCQNSFIDIGGGGGGKRGAGRGMAQN